MHMKLAYLPLMLGYVTQFVLLGAISALELLNAYILANLPKPGA